MDPRLEQIEKMNETLKALDVKQFVRVLRSYIQTFHKVEKVAESIGIEVDLLNKYLSNKRKLPIVMLHEILGQLELDLTYISHKTYEEDE